MFSQSPPPVSDSDQFFWDDPRKVGTEVNDTNGSTYFRGPGAGTAVYLTHLRAKSRDFIKDGDAIFLLTMEGNQIILKSSHLKIICRIIYVFILFTHHMRASCCCLVDIQFHSLASSPSSDISHLAVSQPLPTPSTTPDIPDACQNVECLNDGVCVVDEGKATCRCVHITSMCKDINKDHLPALNFDLLSAIFVLQVLCGR